jgi:ADP-heptose:LPS heptosyltransferase
MDPDNLQRFGLMRPYVSGQANLYPPKRVKRLRELLDTKAPRICVLRGEGMGDVIMTTPTCAALKNAFPEPAHITYATNTRYLEGGLVKVLAHNPSIDEVVDRDQLDEGDYDLVINLHCPCIAYEKIENPPINRIDLFAAHAGVELTDKVPKYYMQPEELAWGRDFLSRAKMKQGDKIIMVHVFTTTTRRNLDSRTFKDALMQLVQNGYKLVVLSHDTDYPSSVMFGNIPNSVVLSEDIRKVAGTMVACDMVLCPDSSVLHLAGALGVPTVSLFGHTDPRARINYYQEAVAIWPGREYSCCPCWSAACNMKQACYKAISKDMIVEACEELVGKTSKPEVSLPPQNTIHIERI